MPENQVFGQTGGGGILAFMIPMLIGNIAQQMYNAADSVVVGKYLGDNALAAVGNAGPIINLLIVLFVGIRMGASIVVSQYLGKKDREALSLAIGNCIILTAISTTIVMLIAVLFTRPLLVVLYGLLFWLREFPQYCVSVSSFI